MAGDSKSVTESLLLIGIIIFWNYVLDWLGFQSKVFRRLLDPEKLPVIEDGKFLRENMRRELITTDELMSQMRESGIEDVSEIKTAHLESDGQFSFIKKNDDEARRNPKRERRQITGESIFKLRRQTVGAKNSRFICDFAPAKHTILSGILN
jgi:uncharacterized membrane protein YcaP (DUF421 family)